MRRTLRGMGLFMLFIGLGMGAFRLGDDFCWWAGGACVANRALALIEGPFYLLFAILGVLSWRQANWPQLWLYPDRIELWDSPSRQHTMLRADIESYSRNQDSGRVRALFGRDGAVFSWPRYLQDDAELHAWLDGVPEQERVALPPDTPQLQAVIRRRRLWQLRLSVMLRGVTVLSIVLLPQLHFFLPPLLGIPKPARLEVLTHDAQGRVWLGLDHTLWLGDAAGHTLRWVDTVPGPYRAICAYEDGVAVSSAATRQLYLLDGRGQVQATLTPPGGIRALAYADSGKLLYVLSQDEDTILAYRNGQEVAHRRHIGNWGPLSVAADGRLWLSDREQRRFLVFSPDLRQERILPLGSNAQLYPLAVQAGPGAQLQVLLAPLPPFNSELGLLDTRAGLTRGTKLPWYAIPAAFSRAANGEVLVTDASSEHIWRVQAGKANLFGDAALSEQLQQRRWYRWYGYKQRFGGLTFLAGGGFVLLLLIVAVEWGCRQVVRRKPLRMPLPKPPLGWGHLANAGGVVMLVSLVCWLPAGQQANDLQSCLWHWGVLSVCSLTLACLLFVPPERTAVLLLLQALRRADVARPILAHGAVRCAYWYAPLLPQAPVRTEVPQTESQHLLVFTERALLHIVLNALDFSLLTCTAIAYADIQLVALKSPYRFWSIVTVPQPISLQISLHTGGQQTLTFWLPGTARLIERVLHRQLRGQGKPWLPPARNWALALLGQQLLLGLVLPVGAMALLSVQLPATELTQLLLANLLLGVGVYGRWRSFDSATRMVTMPINA